MRHLALLSWISGAAAVGVSSSGRAQNFGVRNPTYANLYWEASSSKNPPFTTGSWDGDVQLAANNNVNPYDYTMTKDMIDSMLRSMPQSDWVDDMGPYTVYVANPNIPVDCEILPDNPGLSSCVGLPGSPPPIITSGPNGTISTCAAPTAPAHPIIGLMMAR
jgi:hypothetical protein